MSFALSKVAKIDVLIFCSIFLFTNVMIYNQQSNLGGFYLKKIESNNIKEIIEINDEHRKLWLKWLPMLKIAEIPEDEILIVDNERLKNRIIALSRHTNTQITDMNRPLTCQGETKILFGNHNGFLYIYDTTRTRIYIGVKKCLNYWVLI
jgi:hypothetical protein